MKPTLPVFTYGKRPVTSVLTCGTAGIRGCPQRSLPERRHEVVGRQRERAENSLGVVCLGWIALLLCLYV